MIFSALSEYINANAPMSNIPALLGLHHSNPMGLHPIVIPIFLLVLAVAMRIIYFVIYKQERRQLYPLLYTLWWVALAATYYYCFSGDLPLFEDTDLHRKEVCVGWFCQRQVVGTGWSLLGVALLSYTAYSMFNVLLHVIDLSSPEWEAQAEVVDRLIDELGAAQTPCIRVFNKCDAYLGILPHGENIVCISARSGEGAAELTERVRAILGRADHHVTLLLPYAQGALLETLHRDCAVLRSDYRDDGIALEVIIHPEQWPRLEPFVIPGEEE